MGAIKKKNSSVRTNISIPEDIKREAKRYAAQRYAVSFSSLIAALLSDFVDNEKKKKRDHVDQGKLL